MDFKGTLKAITLELRRELEGKHDAKGTWQPGDLERRLGELGVWRDRRPKPADELTYRILEDREARCIVDAFLQSRTEAGQSREAAIAEFVRNAAYTWANRLLALRCMEARGIIDEVILQKDAYGGRSLQHNRLARKQPERCAGEDEGLFAALFDEFTRRADELPLLFDPRAPEVALRPSIASLKRCITLLSGKIAVKGQEPATDEVFTAPDALGWAYQYWNTEEKDRVFEKVRTRKGAKIEGAEIIPATCIYTEPYMVKFLVQNSLGAVWMGMHPESELSRKWEYFVCGADRAPVSKKPVSEITFLDPACGSGHFLIEAFELFYAMYEHEGTLTAPAEICASILERNVYGIDIDERAVQIAALALVMKAKEKAPEFVPRRVNLVATNIRLPSGKEHLEAFLQKHPEDAPLKPALLAIFEGLAHADELGSLLQIEEPVDRELRHLRDQQLARERKAGAAELFAPRKDEDWSAWKHSAIERLREHFNAEARDNDLAAAFFGEAASKGLSLIDLLAGRYDVVAANPPYMGSKNAAPVLKEHIERHFSPGKRDLYAAFIVRCSQLTASNGRVAMVTQQSWMFMPAFAGIRGAPEGRERNSPFAGLLRASTIEVLVHLGPRAFDEIGGEIVNSALFIAALSEPNEMHSVTAFRLVAPAGATQKQALLRKALSGETSGVVFKPRQSRFLTIPGCAICYWLRPKFIEILSSTEKVGACCTLTDGVSAADKFVRFLWEVPRDRERWPIYQKGGGYRKWFGFNVFTCDWHGDGAKVRQHILERYPAEKFSLKYKPFDRRRTWVTWSDVASGSMGARLGSSGDILGSKGPGATSEQITNEQLLALFNCRAFTYLLRTTSTTLQFSYPSVRDAPGHWIPHEGIVSLVNYAIAEKRILVSDDPREANFYPWTPRGNASLRSLFWAWREDRLARTARLLSVEASLEKGVFRGIGLSATEADDVIRDTGRPAGWFPLIAGYDAVPAEESSGPLIYNVTEALVGVERRALSAEVLTNFKARLNALYLSGPGGDVDATNEASVDGDEAEDGESAETESGARIPIPTETFLEELSQKLEIHPISVYWLLRELREREGVVSNPELVRFVEDYLSVLVLRLLGHRWPREIEMQEPVPAWADKGGIILLTQGASEAELIARVRARLAYDFGAERAGSVEREFQEITGRPLEAWLASDFFRRHISQFRKRPIAWQITSSGASNTRRRRRGLSQTTPAFSCILNYHRLDTDLLPKLRTHYIGPLRMSLQTELGNLEKIAQRSADQDTRRLELEGKLEELKAFDAQIEQVLVLGFGSQMLDETAAKEPLDKWTSRDGRAHALETREAFLAQERRYDPNLNDGVRVNIAPLQRAGLLAADVLVAKDVEKAIADRAEWRADERRWCREGKLPQPGWWAEEVAEVKAHAAVSKGKTALTKVGT